MLDKSKYVFIMSRFYVTSTYHCIYLATKEIGMNQSINQLMSILISKVDSIIEMIFLNYVSNLVYTSEKE